MRTLYFDAFSGASGDMILGALVDLGGDFAGLRSALSKLGRGRFELHRRKVVAVATPAPTRTDSARAPGPAVGLAATKIDVRVTADDAEERSFREIAAIIRSGDLPVPVRDLALEIFRRLCAAEAKAHGVAFDRVHLHEAGAIDAIADICGAAWLIRSLDPDRIVVSPLNVGSGTIECRHGTYPVPGPATVRLLRGIPVYADGAPGERVTPTGAAILSTIASEFRPMPLMVARAVGHGAGDRVFADRPNVLRAILGDDMDRPPEGRVTIPGGGPNDLPGGPGDVMVIEATIDDMNPQNYGFLLERAIAEGALEVFFSSVLMKKGRPGMHVTAIVAPERFEAVSKLVFRETTTIGFRYRRESRRELDREFRIVETPYGRVRLKASSDRGEVVQVQPEYEDCRRLAERRNVPLKEVQRAALAAWNPSKPPAPPPQGSRRARRHSEPGGRGAGAARSRRTIGKRRKQR